MIKRKIFLIVLGLVLMASLTIAGIATGISRDIEIDTGYKEKIGAINDDTLERGDINCDNLAGTLDGSEQCFQKMWKGDYKLGEVTVSAVNCSSYNETIINDETNETDGNCILWVVLSDEEIKTLLSEGQEEKLKAISDAMSSRKNKTRTVIEDAGEIILKERQVKAIER
jgi:hypothetical protein